VTAAHIQQPAQRFSRGPERPVEASTELASGHGTARGPQTAVAAPYALSNFPLWASAEQIARAGAALGRLAPVNVCG
jgi:hypothetical protein